MKNTNQKNGLKITNKALITDTERTNAYNKAREIWRNLPYNTNPFADFGLKQLC